MKIYSDPSEGAWSVSSSAKNSLWRSVWIAYFAIFPRLINAEAKKLVVYIYIYKYHLATSITDIFARPGLGYMILIKTSLTVPLIWLGDEISFAAKSWLCCSATLCEH